MVEVCTGPRRWFTVVVYFFFLNAVLNIKRHAQIADEGFSVGGVSAKNDKLKCKDA